MTTNTEALPYTSERHFALRDAHTIAAGDAYFEVRPHLTAFGPHRLTFDAGFVRGFDKATELADERAVAELRRLSAVEAERDALRAALSDAATSLETIGRLAGKPYYGLDDKGEPIPTYMGHNDEVRSYANSRAGAARAAMKGTQ